MKRIAIIATHPVQYNAPWYALLNQQDGVAVRVFYTWSQRQQNFSDSDFGKEIQWDIPLLEGYEYRFCENKAKNPGNHHFKGIRCPNLIHSIKEWGASHLLVMGWNFFAHLNAMRHFKGKVPVLFRGDSTLLDESRTLKTFLRRMALKWVYRYVDIALVVGSSNREYFLVHGLPEQALIDAPHAIDNSRFLDSETNQYEQRAKAWKLKLDIPDSARVILFAGKMIHKKQPEWLIKAFHQLKTSSSAEWKLIMVGEGALDNSIKIEANRDPDIHWLPFQNQTKMPVVYRLADIFCLPSSGPGETWGLSVNEAMASGKPCLISSKAGCAADLAMITGNQEFISGSTNDFIHKAKQFPEPSRFKYESFLDKWNYHQLIKGVLRAIEKTDQK